MTLVLNTEEVVQALDANGYIEAMEEAFTELGNGAAINSPRTETGIPLLRYGTEEEIKKKARALLRDLPEDADAHQSTTWMRAAKKTAELNYRLKTIVGGYPKCGIMALKIDSTTDTNPSLNEMKRSVKLPLGAGWRYTGMMLLFDIVTGELQAILPLGPLQRNRVAATSALGIKYLARKDASTLGLFGTGFQAEGQLAYAAQVRKLTKIKVYSPNSEHRRSFAEKMEKAAGIEVIPVEKPEAVCRGADIVASATTSLTPVFQTRWLDEGTHLGSINIVEADRASFTRSDLVVVNARPFAGGTSDLVRDYVMGKRMDTVGSNINKQSKKLNWRSMRELGELLTGKIKGRKNDGEITFHCNNIGLGVQHAATGSRILANARRLGLGKEIPTDWFLQKEHT
ncbi:MAG TPA: ornithine cyclodeaminase family protein [Candidatus Binatia bacterium]|jgi:alanine dehydrogenase